MVNNQMLMAEVDPGQKEERRSLSYSMSVLASEVAAVTNEFEELVKSLSTFMSHQPMPDVKIEAYTQLDQSDLSAAVLSEVNRLAVLRARLLEVRKHLVL